MGSVAALCESKVTRQLQRGESSVNGPEKRLAAIFGLPFAPSLVPSLPSDLGAEHHKYYARGTICSLPGFILRRYLLNRK